MFQSKKLPLCFWSISKIHIVVVYNSVLSYHVSDTAIASNISVIDARSECSSLLLWQLSHGHLNAFEIACESSEILLK